MMMMVVVMVMTMMSVDSSFSCRFATPKMAWPCCNKTWTRKWTGPTHCVKNWRHSNAPHRRPTAWPTRKSPT